MWLKMGIGPEFPAIVLRKMMIHQWIWGYPIFKQTQILLTGIYLLISKFGRWTMVNKKRNVVHLRLDVIDCPGLVIRYSMLAGEVHGRERPAGLLVRNNTFEQRDPFVSLSEKYATLQHCSILKTHADLNSTLPWLLPRFPFSIWMQNCLR